MRDSLNRTVYWYIVDYIYSFVTTVSVDMIIKRCVAGRQSLESLDWLCAVMDYNALCTVYTVVMYVVKDNVLQMIKLRVVVSLIVIIMKYGPNRHIYSLCSADSFRVEINLYS